MVVTLGSMALKHESESVKLVVLTFPVWFTWVPSNVLSWVIYFPYFLLKWHVVSLVSVQIAGGQFSVFDAHFPLQGLVFPCRA